MRRESHRPEGPQGVLSCGTEHCPRSALPILSLLLNLEIFPSFMAVDLMFVGYIV